MHPTDLSRRGFNKLTAAAMSGLLAGASISRAEEKKEQKKKDPNKPLLLQDPHVCRGLNPSCAGETKEVKHECAGQAQYATAKAHECKGMNDCAGLGGCGEHPGENKCKGMGECAVPLKDKTWAKARKNFEAAMTKAKKKFGDAPKKKA